MNKPSSLENTANDAKNREGRYAVEPEIVTLPKRDVIELLKTLEGLNTVKRRLQALIK